MLSKRVIMHEWREFIRRRDGMTDKYVETAQAGPNPDAPPNSPGSPPPRPGTPARAPASLSLVASSDRPASV